MPAHRLIVVEGLPGVGKTSLALRLAEAAGARAVLEAADDNPFLADFYREPRKFAFQAQVYFLLARYRRQEDLRQLGLFEAGVVADCLFSRDRIYAAHALDEGEWRLYEDLYRLLAPGAVRPDLVVYLQASPDRVLESVAARGRSYEAALTRAYVDRLAAAFDSFFFHYDASPLLVASVDEIDFTRDPADMALLRRAVETAGPGTTHVRRRRAGR